MPRHARIPSSRINNLRVKLQQIKKGTEPFVITKEYTFPEEEWDEFVRKDTGTYYSVNETTKTEGAKYSLRDVYRDKIYIQYGLKTDTSLTRNPLIRFYRQIRSRMHTEIEKVLSLIRGSFTIKSVPCFINGDFSPITKTHYDDYHNIIILLSGSKTFYLARQGSIVNTDNKNENETDSNPHDGTSSFVKATLTPGDMLYIPLGWWHYVESEPNSIMLNFWFVNRL